MPCKQCRLILFLFLFWFSPVAAQEIASLLSLKGHLDKELIEKAEKRVDSATGQLALIINSHSAELEPLLKLAKKIYQAKLEKGLKVIIYIEDSAVGPSAILPLLADRLFISFAVTWGDIPLGNPHALSTNILRNRVVSFITPRQPHAEILELLAAAMSDPSLEIVDGNRWKIAVSEQERSLPRISSPGEPLVINQNQLQQLGLVEEVLAEEQFLKRFELKAQVESAVKETQESPLKADSPLEERLKAHVAYDSKGVNRVGLIRIDDRSNGINEATWIYVKKALDYYKETKPIFIILELNTPGGEVYAAQKISDALKELDTQHNIPVVAFINNWAISAGAMLAYSSRFITAVSDAAMGAAEPLQVEASGETKTASEKVNSALRADFANRAAFFGRNRDLAEAMVDKDIILVYRYGKIVRLDNESDVRTTGPDRDRVITPKGKLLTLNSEQLVDYGVADILVPSAKREAITQEEKEKGEWPAAKSPLFAAPFFKEIPNAVILPYQMDWKTQFFVLLAHPVASSLLFMGLMIGLYMEMSTPGFGLPGTVALTCLFLIVLSSFALEIGHWLELILLLTGLGVLLIEFFVLPTFGLLGFIGLIFFLVGLFGLMLPNINAISYEWDTNTFNAAGEAFLTRLVWLCGALVLGFGIILVIARYVTPVFANFSRFVLAGNEQEGYIAGVNPQLLPQPGAEGEVISTLRPAGKVLIQDEIYDAISRGAFIERGEKVVVEQLEGSVIVVGKKEEEQA